MLKNKKAIYLLIPLNLAVWGFFVYRFYTAYYQGEEITTENTFVKLPTSALTDSAVYALKLNYPDPFLKDAPSLQGTGHTYAQNTATALPKPRLAPAPPPAAKPPADIKYLGLIKNTTSGMATALVSVNGQTALLKLNESLNGLTIKSFNRDSLVAKSGKERLVLYK